MYGLIITLSFCSVTAFSFDVKASEGKFDGHKFLTLNYDAQKSFMQTSLTMAGAIAGRAKPNILKCLQNWFPNDDKIRGERYQEMLGYVRKHPQHSPTAIVLLTIEKQCGRFED